MNDASSTTPRRYRRRIIGWGLVVLLVAFVVPAVVAVRWVQNDLERRVPQALADGGVPGVDADFSGQAGTLRCDVPLADPEAAVGLAEDVFGVDRIDLDSSCRVGDGSVEPTPSSTVAATTAPATDPPVTDAEPSDSSTTVASSAPPSTEPEQETVSELTAADPQFNQLASLLEQTGLDETLSADGPFTLLAPTDAAFDVAFEAVGADAFQELVADPDTLRAVLLHHVTAGTIAAADFETGPLTMLDDSSIQVDLDDDGGVTFTSGELVASPADPAQLDIEAANGVIHAIDQVLIPAAVDVESDTTTPTTSATLENGRFTLAGTVESEEQRAAIVEAARAQVSAENVLDQLVVDSLAPLAAGDLERFTRAVAAMPANLVSGTVTLVGDVLSLSGVHTGDDAAAALEAIGEDVGAQLDLTARVGADETSAQALQDELNEFVRENPLLFEPDSIDLTAEAGAVVEQVVARAQRFDGVEITIIGHTDSEGDAVRNQLLSEGRADTVRAELVERGVPAERLTVVGRGEAEPILDADGNEDAAASRRVEFTVRALG